MFKKKSKKKIKKNSIQHTAMSSILFALKKEGKDVVQDVMIVSMIDHLMH